MFTLPIYMDSHATTLVDRRVVETMLPYFGQKFGNAASRSHRFGWEADEAVERARLFVAGLIGAKGREIIFTSGATESNNLAIKGVARALGARGNHIVTVQTEHRSILDPCRRLESEGSTITYVPVGRDGLVDPADIARAITPRTMLISVMAANNEVGVLHPIAEIGAIARARGVPFHTDATQAVGTIPFDVTALQVDLVSLSAHKIYGPKGIGALYVRRGSVSPAPLIDGGGHERGLRSGTLNVPGIVGLGRAAELARVERQPEGDRLRRLRDRLKDGLLDRIPDVVVNGSLTCRLPHNLNVSFGHVPGESLLLGLDDVAVSSGSACTSAKRESSYVLRAMGLSDELARASIRFGLGRFNTDEEVDYVIDKVASVVTRLREMARASH